MIWTGGILALGETMREEKDDGTGVPRGANA